MYKRIRLNYQNDTPGIIPSNLNCTILDDNEITCIIKYERNAQ